jgi:hypothetical protein
MRMREIISEAMAQSMVHRNTTIGTVKALARNSKSRAARFVIHDGKLHASDAEEFTHYDIWPLQKGLRGWVYHDGDAFTYKAVGIYDMHPADDPLLRAFERAGIARESAALAEKVERLPDGVIAYHGGPQRIESFLPLSHFGSKTSAIQRLAQRRTETAYLHRAKLKITNPLRVDDMTASGEASLLLAVLRGEHPDLDRDILRREGTVAGLQAAGYDGMVYNNRMEDRGRLSYVVLNPDQVEILDIVDVPLRRKKTRRRTNENAELATLVKNPSPSQIKNLLAKYHPYGLRGVHADNTFWVWNAYDTTHHYVSRKLGLVDPDEFVIRTNEYGTEVSDHTGNGALGQNERFVKMMLRLDEPYWVGKVVPEALRRE